MAKDPIKVKLCLADFDDDLKVALSVRKRDNWSEIMTTVFRAVYPLYGSQPFILAGWAAAAYSLTRKARKLDVRCIVGSRPIDPPDSLVRKLVTLKDQNGQG